MNGVLWKGEGRTAVDREGGETDKERKRIYS